MGDQQKGQGASKGKEMSSARAVVLKPQLYLHPLEAALKQSAGPQPQSFCFSESRWGLRIYISNKFPGDAAVQRPCFENHQVCEVPLKQSVIIGRNGAILPAKQPLTLNTEHKKPSPREVCCNIQSLITKGTAYRHNLRVHWVKWISAGLSLRNKHDLEHLLIKQPSWGSTIRAEPPCRPTSHRIKSLQQKQGPCLYFNWSSVLSHLQFWTKNITFSLLKEERN